MTVTLESLTIDPVGSENGLVTRNIPFGIQMVEVTDGYGNILGTASNPINITSSGSNRVETMFTAMGFSGVNSETMITLTPYVSYVAGSSGTSFGVTSGKILKIHSIMITGATGAGVGVFKLKVSSSGTVTTSTPTIIPHYFQSSLVPSGVIVLPDGIELSGNNQIGISHTNSNPALSYNISILGYEY